MRLFPSATRPLVSLTLVAFAWGASLPAAEAAREIARAQGGKPKVQKKVTTGLARVAKRLRIASTDADLKELTDKKYNTRDPGFPETYRQVATFAADQLAAAGVKPLVPAAETPGVTGADRYFHEIALGGSKSWNVIGVRRGAAATKDAVVVIAHLDHIFGNGGGADDNASGSATVLEIMRRMKDVTPGKNVIAILATAEERGLVGTRRLIEQRVIENAGYKVTKVINFDMTAGGPAKEVEIYGGPSAETEQANPLFQAASKHATEKGMKAIPGKNKSSIFFRSDHAAFYQAGITKEAILFSDARYPHYHTSRDTLDRLTAGKADQVADVGFALTNEVVGRPLTGVRGHANSARRRMRAEQKPLEEIKLPPLPDGWKPY